MNFLTDPGHRPVRPGPGRDDDTGMNRWLAARVGVGAACGLAWAAGLRGAITDASAVSRVHQATAAAGS